MSAGFLCAARGIRGLRKRAKMCSRGGFEVRTVDRKKTDRYLRAIGKNEHGAKIVLFNAPGPICSATVVVATTPVSDAGHPHCLEHLVFMGSKRYPKRGYLDMLATRNCSDGTNAWTCVDHTAYTIATAGKEGLLQVLPVYLDHVLNPTLTEEHFLHEVYHVRGDGEEAGVVFQEMHCRENTEGDLVSLAWHRALFPGTSLALESGGRTPDIAKLSNKEVEAFHRSNYSAGNITVIVVGGPDIAMDECIDAVHPILDAAEAKNKDSVASSGTRKVKHSRLKEAAEEVIDFPSADEEVGSVTIAWQGPTLSDIESTVACETLLQFLTENEASALSQRFVEIEHPLASSVDFSVELLPTSAFVLGFGGVPTGFEGSDEAEWDGEDESDEMDDDADLNDDDDGSESEGMEDDGRREEAELLQPQVFSSMVFEELDKILRDGLPGGLNAMKETVRRYRRDLLLELENDPHNYVVDALIPDAVHNGGLDVGSRISAELTVLKNLLQKDEHFWLKTLSDWFVGNDARVTIVARPSVKLSQELADERAASLKKRVKALGDHGLEKLGRSAREAIERSRTFKNFPADAFPPAPDHSAISRLPFRASRRNQHMQLVAVESAFSYFNVALDTRHIPARHRELLPLFCSLLFNVDVTDKDRKSVQNYMDVVRALSKATIHATVGVGRNSGTFRAGTVPECLVVDFCCERGRESEAIRLVLASMFRATPTKERVNAMLARLHSDAIEVIRDGDAVCRAMSRMLVQKARNCKDSNTLQVTILKQKRLLEELMKLPVQEVIAGLEKLRDALVCSRVPFLHVGGSQPELMCAEFCKIWQEEGGELGTDNEATAYALEKVPECTQLDSLSLNPIVPIAGTESSYLRVTIDCPVGHEHEDFFPLEVLCELLGRTEGPLYEAIRGAGLAYGTCLVLNPYQRQLIFSVDESSVPHEAWDAFVKLVEGLKGADQWKDATVPLEIEAAKAAMLYALHGDRSTPSTVVDVALGSASRGVLAGEDHFAWQERSLNEVSVADLRRVFEKYILKFTAEKTRIAVVTCSPVSKRFYIFLLAVGVCVGI
mmetsp:Transcript_3962/g.11876  ORF Transcript_3962/g.11876 Transcript_3962/m.11876 type:complete len:1062 (-) Transcript_3962:3184-6369(-)